MTTGPGLFVSVVGGCQWQVCEECYLLVLLTKYVRNVFLMFPVTLETTVGRKCDTVNVLSQMYCVVW